MKLKKRAIEVSYYNKEKMFYDKSFASSRESNLNKQSDQEQKYIKCELDVRTIYYYCKTIPTKKNCKSRLYNTIKITRRIKLQRTTIMHNITQTTIHQNQERVFRINPYFPLMSGRGK